jgi:hypothetical protein
MLEAAFPERDDLRIELALGGLDDFDFVLEEDDRAVLVEELEELRLGRRYLRRSAELVVERAVFTFVAFGVSAAAASTLALWRGDDTETIS